MIVVSRNEAQKNTPSDTYSCPNLVKSQVKLKSKLNNLFFTRQNETHGNDHLKINETHLGDRLEKTDQNQPNRLTFSAEVLFCVCVETFISITTSVF